MKPDWHAAAKAGDVERLEQLLRGGYDVDARDEHGNTALMLAALHGWTAAALVLIRRGADLNHAAKYHLTALMLAVINGRGEIVRALVEAGADLSVRGSGAPGFHGKTALDLAIAREGDDAATPPGASIASVIRAAMTEQRDSYTGGRLS